VLAVQRFAAAVVTVSAAFCGSDLFKDSSRALDVSPQTSLNKDREQPLFI